MRCMEEHSILDDTLFREHLDLAGYRFSSFYRGLEITRKPLAIVT